MKRKKKKKFEKRSFDGPTALLASLARNHPRLAYRLADRLGSTRNALTRRWPAADEVRILFPQLDERAATQLAREMGALHERNRVLVHLIAKRGLDPLRSIVTMGETLRSLNPPRIFGTFHVGALNAIGAALEQLGAPVLAFRRGTILKPRPPLEIVSTRGTDQDRAAALHRALRHLRHGGFVVLALDEAPSRGIETSCLQHNLRLAPGAFALQKWSGAPINPLFARWTGDGIVVDAADDVRTADDAAAWLESYVSASPSELTLGLLRKLLGVN